MNVARVFAVWAVVSVPAALVVAALIRSSGGGDLIAQIERFLRRREVGPRALAARSMRVGVVVVMAGAAVAGSLQLAGDLPGRIVAVGIRTTLFFEPPPPTPVQDAQPDARTGSRPPASRSAANPSDDKPPTDDLVGTTTTVTTSPPDAEDELAFVDAGDGLSGDTTTADTASHNPRESSPNPAEQTTIISPSPDDGAHAPAGTTTTTTEPEPTTTTTTTTEPEPTTTTTTEPEPTTTTTTEPEPTTTTTTEPEPTTTTTPDESGSG